MLEKIPQLLEKIPAKTVAAFASIPKNWKAVLAYKFAMNDAILSVVIPQIHKISLLKYLKNSPPAEHKEILKLATTEQKKAYLSENMITLFSPRKKWKKARTHLERAIADFNQNPTQTKYETIEKEWRKKLHSLRIALTTYERYLQALKQILPEYSKKLKPDTEKLLMKEETLTRKMNNEMKQMGTKIVDELAEKVTEKSVKIPGNFLDLITDELMQNPYKDENGRNCDKTTWDRCDLNPFTNQEKVLTANAELQEEIRDFFDEHPEMLEKN